MNRRDALIEAERRIIDQCLINASVSDLADQIMQEYVADGGAIEPTPTAFSRGVNGRVIQPGYLGGAK